MATQKTALIFGATGLIGGQLLQRLLHSPAYGQVIAVVRRNLGITHPKLKSLTADYQSIESVKSELIADDVFCCLGTTRKKTPDLKAYYRIDHDYPVTAAKLAKANGATAFLLVSAIGANPDSSNFYIRMKGETERDVQQVGFERLHIFRPSLLKGNRGESRWMESAAAGLFTVIDPLLMGGLKRYRSITGDEVADAMLAAAQKLANGTQIYYWKDMKQLR